MINEAENLFGSLFITVELIFCYIQAKKNFRFFILDMELSVGNYQSNISKPQVSFKRKLHEDEKPKYEADINEAFKYLGIKNRALIIHGSVYPDAKEGSKNPHDFHLARLQYLRAFSPPETPSFLPA